MNSSNHTAFSPAGANPFSERDEFCICRVLEDCALIKIEAMAQLPAARKYMLRVASRAPGSYVVFSYRTRRVLGKVVTRAA
jgi:hypothetical protein